MTEKDKEPLAKVVPPAHKSREAKDRPALLLAFVRREWISIFAFSALGALAAGVLRLLVLDGSFQRHLATKYVPAGTLDSPKLYLPYVVSTAVAVLLAVILRVPAFAARGLRSWWAGVTSGLGFLSFTLTFVLLLPQWHSAKLPAGAFVATLTLLVLLGFNRHLHAKNNAEKKLSNQDIRVSSEVRSVAGTHLSESDEPIRTWAEDALGRASIVDAISVKLLISKSPVVALFGEFGSGKTSILNLLREHLTDRAIIVSFSTWLPGSAETLTAYLLSDIANECEKQYVVPGLRKGAQRLARALGRNVPLLKSFVESLPASTQRDDLQGMKDALSRLPKRVVVLLDELDRMEKDELVTLLKIIRGVSALPNLSFVCAGARKTITEIVKEKFSDESNTYFEKFFPVSIQIPEPDPVALRQAGVTRLASAFDERDFFERGSEAEAFRNQITTIWSEHIAPFCRNLRAIGLLVNDVGTAAAPLGREVNPIDLTLIELLRRFKPLVYEIVSKNSPALTGGESIARGGPFRLDKENERAEQKLLEDLRSAAPN
jgi:hypothetical protein